MTNGLGPMRAVKALPDLVSPEIARQSLPAKFRFSVPIRARDRLGDLGKAAVDAAIPGVPVVEDHDPLKTAAPFPALTGASDPTNRIAPKNRL